MSKNSTYLRVAKRNKKSYDRAKLQIKSEKPLFWEDFFRGRGAILTPHGLSVIGGNKRQKVKILKFRMWFKYGLKAQKLLAQGIARKQHALFYSN